MGATIGWLQSKPKLDPNIERRQRDFELRLAREALPWRHRLKAWRIAKGMTGQELAEAAGVTKDAISRYESYDREMPLAVQARICAALDVTPALLYQEPDSEMAKILMMAEASPETRRKILKAIAAIQIRHNNR